MNQDNNNYMCNFNSTLPFEEEMLVAGMDGYGGYQNRAKYKLIPGIY